MYVHVCECVGSCDIHPGGGVVGMVMGVVVGVAGFVECPSK